MSSREQQILDDLFASALRDGVELAAAEVMQAIGLKRTSIYSTYAHINARRKAHNMQIREADPSAETVSTSMELERLKESNARLRHELKLERELSDRYARSIRALTLENHQLKLGDSNVSDARGRFGAHAAHDRP